MLRCSFLFASISVSQPAIFCLLFCPFWPIFIMCTKDNHYKQPTGTNCVYLNTTSGPSPQTPDIVRVAFNILWIRRATAPKNTPGSQLVTSLTQTSLTPPMVIAGWSFVFATYLESHPADEPESSVCIYYWFICMCLRDYSVTFFWSYRLLTACYLLLCCVHIKKLLILNFCLCFAYN